MQYSVIIYHSYQYFFAILLWDKWRIFYIAFYNKTITYRRYSNKLFIVGAIQKIPIECIIHARHYIFMEYVICQLKIFKFTIVKVIAHNGIYYLILYLYKTHTIEI